MDERESSVASSADFYGSEPASQRTMAVTKRKAEDDSSARDKKRKLVSPPTRTPSNLTSCAKLPPAVWQHIFLFCSLADLGRLMQVNRPFLSYLTDVHNVSVSKPDSACLRLLKSESVWASARNALSPRPPKPLQGFSELQMWQLAWSTQCQFCSKSASFTPGEKIWQQGPSTTGVRTVWPFGIRACGPCLMQQCQTETSLLISGASALRFALPFALITADCNYIAMHLLQSTTPPPDVEIGKYYYKKHVDDITQELNNALSLGSAAAEEWLKGLDAKGKERMKAADNWERWEVREQDDTRRQASAASTLAAAPHEQLSKSSLRQIPSPVLHTPVPVAPSLQYAHPRPPTVPPQAYTPQPGQSGSTQPSHQRNLHDANEAKASRKTDIENRCQQLNPPIPPNILRHMDSFKAALQISQPMTDHAWHMLQPRLLAQLPAAQQAEANHVSHAASLSTKPADRRFHDVNSKEAKEAMDREWEDLQRPIRDKLSAYADDFIQQEWDQGKALTFESSPKFAADLLAHVRRKFYEATTAEQHTGVTDGAATKPKLVLENMKWVYDNKIRPLTEQYRKDLFFCNGQDCESSTRPYGFEGVVQHFGAKHTHNFSSGNIVVAWREAEWPEETPFHPDPVSVQHFHPGHASNLPGFPGPFGGYPRAGTITPHMPTHMPQASPGPYYGGNYDGPFRPPQPPVVAMAGYNYNQQFGPPVENYAYAPMGPPGYVNQIGTNSYIPSPAMGNPAIAPPPPPPPGMAPPGLIPPEPTSNSTDDASHSTSLFDKQVSTVVGMSQDIWKNTSGIKDMPNSLRIYVLLHRVISKFHVEFNHEPNLTHFIDAFSNHEMPKGLRLAPGLSCKACQLESTHQLTGAYYAKPAERKTYTALNLLSHFKTQHLGPLSCNAVYGQQAHPLDWKEGMIELPSDRFISGLIHAAGMDDEKLLIIATVFPSLFPMPLPKIGVIDSSGLASPPLSGTRDNGTITESSGDKSDPSSLASAQQDLPALPKLTDEDDSAKRQHSYRESPPVERRHRVYAEPRYHYVSRDDVEDEYHHPREYMEYAPSPRVIHAGTGYGEYSGRRTAFREHERVYGFPPEDIVYAQPREGSHGREYGAFHRPSRYYGDEDARAESRYVREPHQRGSASTRGRSAADHFLEDLVPGQAAAKEAVQPSTAPNPETPPPGPSRKAPESVRFTSPPPTNTSTVKETDHAPRQPVLPPPRAPSTVSNGSRHEDWHSNGRHIPAPDSAGPPRRGGPQRRRDRPHEQRMPSRYYSRYLSVARDEPHGRGPSMSRSQSRRYEEQRRRIDQQETPQPNADPEYEPVYSREHSLDQVSPEDRFYPRPNVCEYVSVQDRLHPYSPPRYRYDDHRGPPPVYVDEYGYPIARIRGDPRHSRGPYISSYQHPARYEPERYEYVPVPYERPPPQRYNSRGEYVYYEERERALPRRPAPAPEIEPEPYEPAGPEIKVESAPVPMPPDGP